jgi:hypothetical protein
LEDYYSDIPWGFHYFRESGAAHLAFALGLAGVQPPRIAKACELAFGQGVTLNINAAADRSVHWYGTDFNSAHARTASELAAAGRHGARLYDLPFADFCTRSALPGFDLVILNGTWSWISDEDRRILTDFLADRLNPGGAFLVHYNALPGALGNGQFRNLVLNCIQRTKASGTEMAAKVPELLEQLRQIIRLNPNYMRDHPDIDDLLAELGAANPDHVAHEYFNHNWKPFRFADMAEMLGRSGLAFAASLDLNDHVGEIHLSARQSDYLAGLDDPVFRESTRDFFLNRSDRTDCWIKSPEILSPGERDQALRSLRFIRTRQLEDSDLLAYGALGEIALSRTVFQPIVDAMPIGEIVDLQAIAAGQPAERSIDALAHDLALLVSRRLVAPVRTDHYPGEEEIASCRGLNSALAELTAAGEDISTFASPVLAGGFAVASKDRQFLAGFLAGLRTPQELADAAAALPVLAGSPGSGEKPMRHRTHTLLSEAETFVSETMPVLQALEMV